MSKQQHDPGFTVEHDGTLYNLREGLIGLKAPSPDPTPAPEIQPFTLQELNRILTWYGGSSHPCRGPDHDLADKVEDFMTDIQCRDLHPERNPTPSRTVPKELMDEIEALPPEHRDKCRGILLRFGYDPDKAILASGGLLNPAELKHQVIGAPLCEGNACKIGGESDQAEDRATPIKEPVNVDEGAAFSIINRAGKALETLGFSSQITIFKSSKSTRMLLSAHPRHKA